MSVLLSTAPVLSSGSAAPSAPTFLGVVTNNTYVNSGTTEQSLGFTAEAGDVIFGVATHDNGVNYSSEPGIVGGFDLQRSTLGGGQVTGQVSYYICSGGETSVTIKAGPSFGLGWSLVAWRGLDTASLFQGSPVETWASTGMPDPGAKSATAPALRVIVGILDDDVLNMTPPSGFSNEARGNAASSSRIIATMWDETGGSLNPGAFGGAGNDAWIAAHYVCNPL